MAEMFEIQSRQTVILLNNIKHDDRSNYTPSNRTTPSSSATPPDSDMPSTNSTPTTTSPPTTIKHFPQELKDMIAAEMLPEFLLSSPISTTDVNLVLDLEELDELETAYTLHTMGIALPPSAKAWMQAIDAKEVVLAILDTDITISASDKIKGRLSSGLLPKCKSVKLLLNFFQDHLICKCLGAASIKMDINIKLRRGRWIAKDVRIENVWPKGNAIPGVRVADIARRALSSCGRTYSGRGVVEKLMFVLQEVLAPVEKRAREEAAEATTLQGLPQELKDDITDYILPPQLQTAPPTTDTLTLTLDLDGFEALEAAYTLRAIGVKLPPSTKHWIQAIEAKKVALIITIDAKASLNGSKIDRNRTYNKFLHKLSSINLCINFEIDNIVSHSLGEAKATATFKMTFNGAHWVLTRPTWTHENDVHRPIPFFFQRALVLDREPSGLASGKLRVTSIACCVTESCGPGYSARGVVEKTLFVLKEVFDDEADKLRKRDWDWLGGYYPMDGCLWYGCEALK